MIPQRAVLLEEHDRLSGGTDPRARPRRLNLHQRDQAVDLRFFGGQLRQDPAEPQRLAAERRPHQVVAGSRRVPFVEDEIEDSKHRRQPSNALFATRYLERHLLRGERALGPDDALGDGGLRDEERPGNFVRRQAAEQPQRERDLRLGREHWVAGDEDEPEQIVADTIRPLVDRRLEIGNGLLFAGELAADLFVLALEPFGPAPVVDGPVLRRGHEPGARVARNARRRPLLERRDECVLGQILGNADVAHNPRKPSNEPRRFDSPDRINGSLRLRDHLL